MSKKTKALLVKICVKYKLNAKGREIALVERIRKSLPEILNTDKYTVNDHDSTAGSSANTPFSLKYSAERYVRERFAGKLDDALTNGPVWRLFGSENALNECRVRQCIPSVRNTKGGERIRWVLHVND